jgi:hypothetical protein
MADSISSEASFLGFDFDFPVWSYVDKLPDRELRVDLLHGTLLTPGLQSGRAQKFFADFARAVPEVLRQHGCSPDQVTAIELLFRRSEPTMRSQEVLVTVEQSDGRRTTDRYTGWPLTRPRQLDGLGRIRRAGPQPRD